MIAVLVDPTCGVDGFLRTALALNGISSKVVCTTITPANTPTSTCVGTPALSFDSTTVSSFNTMLTDAVTTCIIPVDTAEEAMVPVPIPPYARLPKYRVPKATKNIVRGLRHDRGWLYPIICGRRLPKS